VLEVAEIQKMVLWKTLMWSAEVLAVEWILPVSCPLS